MSGKSIYHAVGLMSGSSLDGLDIAAVKFEKKKTGWKFEVKATDCIKFPNEILEMLKQLPLYNEKELKKADLEFGKFSGEQVGLFLKKNDIRKTDVIVSHGHTVRHFPRQGISIQIGSGKEIRKISGITAITDLRKKDVEAGGQGAPIVPIADLLLFSDYDALINLGGIANVSIKKDGVIRAWDICPLNQVFNYFAQKKGKKFDKNGLLASKGKVDAEIKKKLLGFDFFNTSPPKSLDNSYTQKVVQLLECLTIEDALRTWVETSVELIQRESEGCCKILLTGGGAHHSFLIRELKKRSSAEVIVPNTTIVDFKEAIAMAFIGVLKLRNEVNVLSSVTGAKKDTVCGKVWK